MSKENDPKSTEKITEERYARERVTRIMPSDLRSLNLYKMRLRVPPHLIDDTSGYAQDTVICIIKAQQWHDGTYDVAFTHLVNKADRKVSDSVINFSQDGLMIVYEDGTTEETIDPETIEIGYIVGSTDPIDIELAELLAKTEEMTTV